MMPLMPAGQKKVASIERREGEKKQRAPKKKEVKKTKKSFPLGRGKWTDGKRRCTAAKDKKRL